MLPAPSKRLRFSLRSVRKDFRIEALKSTSFPSEEALSLRFLSASSCSTSVKGGFSPLRVFPATAAASRLSRDLPRFLRLSVATVMPSAPREASTRFRSCPAWRLTPERYSNPRSLGSVRITQGLHKTNRNETKEAHTKAAKFL